MSAPTTAAASNPRMIGSYELLDRIGKGAMGVVHRAVDQRTNRQVALKVVAADLDGDDETRSRFFREADIVAGLSHRNVVKVYESGEASGRLFIAMELLDGLTLTEVLKHAKPEIETLFDLFTQLGHGLHAAHERGVFHRDIKPANVFVCNDGLVKILDFGVARLSGSNMTMTGYILGTPDFMSPEQARGEDVDGRSDVFSAAALCYLALTGRKPFSAPDLPAVLHNVMHAEPPALTANEAPSSLAAVIMRGLSKQPSDRPQTAAQLILELSSAWREYVYQTRARGVQVAEAVRQLRGRESEVHALRDQIGVADVPLDSWSEIAPIHRVFARGEAVLEAFPLRRKLIDEVAQLVAEASARVDRLHTPLTAAATNISAAQMALAQDDAEGAQHQLAMALVAVPSSTVAGQLQAEAANLLARQRAQAVKRTEAEAVKRHEAEADRNAMDKSMQRVAAEQETARKEQVAREAAKWIAELVEGARAYSEQGKFDRAISMLEEAIARDAAYQPAIALLAEVQAAQAASELKAEQDRMEGRRQRAALPAATLSGVM